MMEFLRADRMPVADHFLVATAAADQPAPPVTAGEACESCYAYFDDKAELWRHARDRHADDRRLTCPEPGCGRRFFARALCRAHRDEHAAARVSTPPPMTCELCGRPSRNTVAFDRHTAAAHPYARHVICRTCRTYHGDQASLNAHVRLRHGSNNGGNGAGGGCGNRKRTAPAECTAGCRAGVPAPLSSCPPTKRTCPVDR